MTTIIEGLTDLQNTKNNIVKEYSMCRNLSQRLVLAKKLDDIEEEIRVKTKEMFQCIH